jgi:hypothetical protein
MDRRTLLTAGAAALTVVAQTNRAFAQATPPALDYVALTRAFYDTVINPRDFSKAAALLSPNYVSVNPTDAPGPDAAIQRLQTFFNGIDGYWNAPPVWTIDETIAQDTRVAVRGHLDGVRKDAFKMGALEFFGMVHFDGALIVTNTLLFDRAAL